MRQFSCRMLLVLASLVPLCRASFGNTLLVTGSAGGSGDTTYGRISSPFIFDGISPAFFDLFGDIWTVGTQVTGSFQVDVAGPWTLNGISGDSGSGLFNIVSDPFTVAASPDGSLDATGIPITWTAQLHLGSFDIDMAGVGTVSINEYRILDADNFAIVGANADLTGVAQVVPEPSTWTLLAIAGIALILGIRFGPRHCAALQHARRLRTQV